jgi:DNA polymerase
LRAPVGAYKYARQPSTRILCFGYALDDQPPDVWFPDYTSAPPGLLRAIEAGVEFHAWNAIFDFMIWNEIGVRTYGLPSLPIDRFHCSMARALFWGVPAKLEDAALVVGAPLRKDADGARLMKQMMKPRGLGESGEPRWWDREDPDRLIRLGEYCTQDVMTERAVARSLPDMPPEERLVWLLDARMNMRGLRVDLDAVDALQRVVDSEIIRLGRELAELTGYAVTSPSQTARIVRWLRREGAVIDSLDRRVLPLVLKSR